MDSAALQEVFAPYVDTPVRHADGHRRLQSTGEGKTMTRNRHERAADRDAALDRAEARDAARRAVQVALDRRDNGGSV